MVYHSFAQTRFDTARYRTLYDQQGVPGADFGIAARDATNALLQKSRADQELRFGRPDYRVEYQPLEPGVVRVMGVAPTAAEAKKLADDGAEELARQIQAAGGRDILWKLLNQEFYQVLHGERSADLFHTYLRDIIEHHAFPLSQEIASGPEQIRMRFEALNPEDKGYLARALESRFDLWSFEINTRNATLDAWCATESITTAEARRQMIEACVIARPGAQQELAALDQAVRRRQVIDTALKYLTNQGLTFEADKLGPVYRVLAGLPGAAEPRRIPELLGLAALVGLVFGGIGVAMDRSVGVMPKLRELWNYRELIRNLVLRDLRVRYKGSAFGYLWTQLAPLLLMLVFLFVFNVLLQNDIALYPVFLIIGLLAWNFCAEAVLGGTRSVIDNANLIKKVFFPREVLPLVSVFSSLLNYLLSLPMMFLVMAVVQLVTFGELNFAWTFAYLPVLVVIETLFLAGVALFLSTLAVFFRDFVHLIGILLQFWFFLTPVVYPLGNIDRTVFGISLAQIIRWLNPMASLIDFYRDILYGNVGPGVLIPTPGLPSLASLLRVLITSVLVLMLGYWYFQRHSGQFGEEM